MSAEMQKHIFTPASTCLPNKLAFMLHTMDFGRRKNTHRRLKPPMGILLYCILPELMAVEAVGS